LGSAWDDESYEGLSDLQIYVFPDYTFREVGLRLVLKAPKKQMPALVPDEEAIEAHKGVGSGE
jgi:hypothetical protein